MQNTTLLVECIFCIFDGISLPILITIMVFFFANFRKLVFCSQESSDYQHESSDYHESDAVSEDEGRNNEHSDKNYNVKRIFSKKFLYK